jgi:acyl carrier protein
MTTDQTKALAIIADILDVEPDTLSLEFKLEELPDWDSHTFLSVIASLDDEFKRGVSIEQVANELANAETISSLLSCLKI